MGDAFEDRLGQSLNTPQEGRGDRGQDRRAAGAPVRRLRRLQAGDRQRRRRRAPRHAAALPADPPEGRGRGRQARLRREAGRRRRSRRPLRPGNLRAGEEEEALPSSPACACATTRASSETGRSASTTAPSATSSRCRPTTTAGRSGSSPRKPDWSDMDWQMRNWYYFTWLSGDFNVEQHVHCLDNCAWVMGDRYPVRAVGMGGRQVRDRAGIRQHLRPLRGRLRIRRRRQAVQPHCRQQAGCCERHLRPRTGHEGAGRP